MAQPIDATYRHVHALLTPDPLHLDFQVSATDARDAVHELTFLPPTAFRAVVDTLASEGTLATLLNTLDDDARLDFLALAAANALLAHRR